MKTRFLFTAYVVITSAMALLELNDRLQDHYAHRYLSTIEASLPEQIVGMK